MDRLDRLGRLADGLGHGDAIASKANGIGVALIDNTAFDAPTNTALNAGIPVIAYNADVETGFVNNRMAYVGQSNLTAGAAVATHILKYVKTGRHRRRNHRHPRYRQPPAADRRARRPSSRRQGIDFVEVGTSATSGSPEYNKIASWYAGHKDVKFMMSVDGGDSDALAEFIVNEKLKGKVGASGWDVGTPVVDAVQRRRPHLTIDQQAYLQGFDTIMQLFLYNISGGLMKPTDTDTGTAIVTKPIVGPYLKGTPLGRHGLEGDGDKAASSHPLLSTSSVDRWKRSGRRVAPTDDHLVTGPARARALGWAGRQVAFPRVLLAAVRRPARDHPAPHHDRRCSSSSRSTRQLSSPRSA